MNSRNDHRKAPALAGCALACAVSLQAVGLPMGQAYDHREFEDRPDPGGSRV